MGSGADTVHETVDYLTARGEKVGVLKVRLFRPFSCQAFLAALPKTVRSIAVLDRTKEPGAVGDPLYLDVVTALAEAQADGTSPLASRPRLIAGRYGLSSKEFTPAMVKAVFDEIAKTDAEEPLHHRHRRRRDAPFARRRIRRSGPKTPTCPRRCSTAWAPTARSAPTRTRSRSSARKRTSTPRATSSTTRRNPAPSPSRICARARSRSARPTSSISPAFVACHQFEFVDKVDVLEYAAPGAAFLLNAPFPADQVWDHLPRELQEQMIEKRVRFFAIDAYALARTSRDGRAHQHDHADVFLRHRRRPAARTKRSRTSRRRSKKPMASVAPKSSGATARQWTRRWRTCTRSRCRQRSRQPIARPPLVSEKAPDFVQQVTAVMLAGKGDLLPVSAFPVDGTWPMATAKWEKRNIALEIPVWDAKICIQCNQCVLVCPHAAIRAKVYDADDAGRRAVDLQVDAVQGPRAQGQDLHDSGRAGGLHRLQPVRQRLPGEGSHQPEAQSDRHAPAGAAARAGARELRLLPQPSRARSHGD